METAGNTEVPEGHVSRDGKVPITEMVQEMGKEALKPVAPLNSSSTLQDMSRDYAFFSPGVISAVTAFDRDPVMEYCRICSDLPEADRPLAIDYSQKFFNGLGIRYVGGTVIDLDRRLYAIAKPLWERCRDVIAGIAIIDRSREFLATTLYYEIAMVDPFALRRMCVVTELPTVGVTIFGISANTGISYLAPLQYPALPQLVTEPPTVEAVQAYAAELKKRKD